MYGHIDEFLYKYVAGIQPVGSPHMWSDIRFAPALLHDLTWVNATFDSPRGLVSIAYNLLEAGLAAEVRVPLGVSAVFVSPFDGREQVIVAGRTNAILL